MLFHLCGPQGQVEMGGTHFNPDTLVVDVCAGYRGPGHDPLARWVPGDMQVAPVYCQAYQGVAPPFRLQVAPGGTTSICGVVSMLFCTVSTLPRQHAGGTCVVVGVWMALPASGTCWCPTSHGRRALSRAGKPPHGGVDGLGLWLSCVLGRFPGFLGAPVSRFSV